MCCFAVLAGAGVLLRGGNAAFGRGVVISGNNASQQAGAVGWFSGCMGLGKQIAALVLSYCYCCCY